MIKAIILPFAVAALLLFQLSAASHTAFGNAIAVKPVQIKVSVTPSPSIPSSPDPDLSVFVIENTLLTPSNFSLLRTANYTFTNEQLEYFLLARHNISGSFISNAYVLVGPNSSGPPANLSGVICSAKNDLLFRNGTGAGYVNSTTGQQFTNSTDRLFRCLLTAAPFWNGSLSVFPTAATPTGIAWQNFTWLFNPSITNFSVSPSAGNIIYNSSGLFPAFIQITNNNPVEVMLFMTGTDLFGKRAPGARCIGRNTLDIRRVQYRAVTASEDSGFQNVSKKSQYSGCNFVRCRTADGPNGIPLHNGIDPSPPSGQIVLPGETVNLTLQTTAPIMCTKGYDRGRLEFHTLSLA